MPEEPVVIAEDVRRLLHRTIRPDDPDVGEKVSLLSANADTSTRTVYRVLSGQHEALSLDLADRLTIACGYTLAEINVRVRLPSGRVVDYQDA